MVRAITYGISNYWVVITVVLYVQNYFLVCNCGFGIFYGVGTILGFPAKKTTGMQGKSQKHVTTAH